jgi:hypothetical protein
LAWIIIPRKELSCEDNSPCPWRENTGWRILQISLGLITILFVIGRLLLFKLHESPKFLISKGRYEDAVDVLNIIAKKNGKTFTISAQEFERLPSVHNLSNDESVLTMNINRVKLLFTAEYLKTTILVSLIWIFVAVANNMFFGYF